MMSSPHVTKHEMDGGWKCRYYTAILSDKSDDGLWSLSTAELFASSFLTSAGSDLTFAPRMHKVSLDLTLTKACLIDAVHELTNCFTVLKLYRPQSSLPLKMAAWYLGFRPLSILRLIT